MTKKILTAFICVVFLITCMTSCKPENISVASSGAAGSDLSDITTDENISSGIKDVSSGNDTEDKNDKTSSNSSQITTSSIPNDSGKENKNSSEKPASSSSKTDKEDTNNGGTSENETSSKTESSGIKYYNNDVQIGTYHLAMRWCDYYGTDFASREKQFREVVEEGYFNTYFLHAQDTEYLLKEIEIIVENGGTFWLTLWNFHSHKESIQNHERELRKVIDSITKAGYRKYLNGMFMDEPIWNGQANRDFLAQTELYYKTFGLRTFPVFATGEFSGSEGNLNTPAASMGKIATEAMKYVTDVGFDSYGVDVRDKAANGYQAAQYEAWSQTLDTPINNGKDYYIGYKRLLQSRIGHPVNYWYFPTAFEWNIYNGGKANEAFCMAHLEFMAEDMLKEDFNGGIALYTYYRHSSHRTVALAQHLDVTDDKGNYIHFTDFEKWTEYSKLLRKTREKFDSIKATHVDLQLYL